MNSMFVLLLGGLLFANLGSNMSSGSGGELKWTNFADGVKQAATANKKLLIDVYTDWCGWCKKMDSDTYADKDVKNYLTEKYILVKLNAESDTKEMLEKGEATDAQIATAFNVSGYPTTIFLESNGQPITAAPGFMKPAEFLQVLKYIGDDFYKKMEFQEYLKSQAKDSPDKSKTFRGGEMPAK